MCPCFIDRRSAELAGCQNRQHLFDDARPLTHGQVPYCALIRQQETIACMLWPSSGLCTAFISAVASAGLHGHFLSLCHHLQKCIQLQRNVHIHSYLTKSNLNNCGLGIHAFLWCTTARMRRCIPTAFQCADNTTVASSTTQLVQSTVSMHHLMKENVEQRPPCSVYVPSPSSPGGSEKKNGSSQLLFSKYLMLLTSPGKPRLWSRAQHCHNDLLCAPQQHLLKPAGARS